MKKIALLSILALGLTSAAMATTGYKVALGGGVISPNGQLLLSLSKLRTDTPYNISCTINVPDKTKMNFKVNGNSQTAAAPQAKVNNTLIGDVVSGANALLNADPSNNSLVISGLTLGSLMGNGNQGSILFANLDDAVPAKVDNCVADPATPNS